MKVAIYSCIGNHLGQDTENQLAELRCLALSQHHEVYLFVDHQSGKTSDRVQFQKLFAAAARREFQVVLVWALDRFISGSVAEAFGHIEQLLRYDVQFVSRTETYCCTNGPARDFIIPIATWILRQERIRISERTKAGLATARRKGKRLGRPWKVLPRRRIAAEHEGGTSWRQLERKYHIPQSTLRNAIQDLARVGVPQPEDTGDPARGCATEESQ